MEISKKICCQYQNENQYEYLRKNLLLVCKSPKKFAISISMKISQKICYTYVNLKKKFAVSINQYVILQKNLLSVSV